MYSKIGTPNEPEPALAIVGSFVVPAAIMFPVDAISVA